MSTFTNHRAIVSKNGKLLWAADKLGPKGGVKTWYTERLPNETSPSPWRVWAETQRDATGTETTSHQF